MTEKKYDEETLLFVDGAKEDLQRFLATAGKSTSEKDLALWQLGYLAGVNRAMGIKNN